jgi:hypothetical protein
VEDVLLKFLIWMLLFVVCWPVALLALILYPVAWLLTLPFRLIGIGVEAIFETLRALLMLPARVLRGPSGA